MLKVLYKQLNELNQLWLSFTEDEYFEEKELVVGVLQKIDNIESSNGGVSASCDLFLVSPTKTPMVHKA